MKKSSDFDEILYTAAYFELDERYVALVQMKKLHWTDSEFDRTYFLLLLLSLFITTSMDDHDEEKRREQNLFVRSGKTEAEV